MREGVWDVQHSGSWVPGSWMDVCRLYSLLCFSEAGFVFRARGTLVVGILPFVRFMIM